ncbi:unnamed protein product, partial [Ectocarpus sp. 12 AP-2014]
FRFLFVVYTRRERWGAHGMGWKARPGLSIVVGLFRVAGRVHAPLRGRDGVQADQQHGAVLQRRRVPRQQDQGGQGGRDPRTRQRGHVHRQARHGGERLLLQERRQD